MNINSSETCISGKRRAIFASRLRSISDAVHFYVSFLNYIHMYVQASKIETLAKNRDTFNKIKRLECILFPR